MFSTKTRENSGALESGLEPAFAAIPLSAYITSVM